MRVLNVDDNLSNLYFIEALVRGYGHEAVNAKNGLEGMAALEQAERNDASIDLIVSDILMPDMDGFQFCRKVKTHPRFKKVPFVIYTATYTAKQDEEFGLSLGASRFIIKPAEPDQFMAVLDEVFRTRDAQMVPEPEPASAEDYFKVYNQRLVNKLERKVEQLETAHEELKSLIAERDREIARRIQAEEGLRRSEEQLRLVWENSLDGMRLSAADGTVLRINPALARMLGISGQRLESVVMTGDDKKRLEALAAERQSEQEVVRPDGAKAFLEGASTSFRSPGGPLLFSVFRDITPRRRAEEERASLEAQLGHARKMESVGRMAAGVAHDFNNLLTVINGYSEMLMRNPPQTTAREMAGHIHHAAKRATDLTSQLLAFSRKKATVMVPVDLNRLIRESTAMLRRLVGEHIELRAELDRNLPAVVGDPGQFLQILMNLAANARDAMEPGGTLTISTAGIASVAGEASVSLKVADTGIGIPKEVQPHIFDPFFTTRDAGEGTGLGLFTVSGIVQRSGGLIQVESAPDRGTTFEILLPAAREPVAAPPPPEKNPGPRSGETVLVVDDRADVRQVVVLILGSAGYNVIDAAGGENALQVALSYTGNIDLLLTDVLMPGMTGPELFDRFRRIRPRARVLYMSGNSPPGAAGQRESLEAISIMKPFGAEELPEKVRQVLDSLPRGAAAGA